MSPCLADFLADQLVHLLADFPLIEQPQELPLYPYCYLLSDIKLL